MLGKAFLLAIEGSIAVGKTSLARLITERLEARLVLEDFQDNPFLEDFYRKPELYAFQTQLWFLLSRYRQQQ
ncbi:MAG: deoxynucleoside kinase, partial [Candidatus Marinimicrobia bacterium]|nr:deoxynucleoside kinase [Candidatus Neomarinimicrobiota bacterium]